MSFRGIFIYKLSNNNQQKPTLQPVLSKCYPTVEIALKDTRQDYLALPNLKNMPILVLEAIGLHANNKTFIESRDSCAVQGTRPIFTLRDTTGEYWPFLVLEEDGYLFCCLGADYTSEGKRDIFQKSVADGFDFLRQLTNFFKTLRISGQQDEESTARHVMETYSFLATTCPFGTPLCCEPDFVSAIHSGIETQAPANAKLPTVAWRPNESKSKRKSISLFIQEYVQAFQHENIHSEAICYLEVTGELLFQCEVGGTYPEISVNLKIPVQKALKHCLFHPLCTYTDYENVIASATSQEPRTSMAIRFVPPRSSPLPQRLLGYHVSPAVDPPISGFYQMRVDDTTATLLLRLRISPEVMAARRQGFLGLMDVNLPFPRRMITDYALVNVSQGTVALSVSKNTLIWNTGTMLPKSAELTLSGKISLMEVEAKNLSIIDDLCVGHNAYAQIRFKFNDYNYSSMSIDSKTVHCTTEPKIRVSITKTLVSREYRIWNTLGDTPIVSHMSVETRTTDP